METLPTILNQNVSQSDYNILIVNNNSNDPTQDFINNIIKDHKNLSSVNESKQGLAYARNTGYLHSQTDWIVYLDDDALVPEDFIAKSMRIITSNEYDCFGGVYSPWYKYGKPKWFKDIYASTVDYLKENSGRKLQYPSGGIMAIKKSILNKYNGFPTQLGMQGNTLAYGEETNLLRQMERDGYKLGIIPDWNMEHIVNRYKLKPSWYIKNGYVTGRDAWTIYFENVTFKKIAKYTIYMFRDLFKHLFSNTLKLFSKDFFWQNWVVETLQPAAMQFGRIIGGTKQILKRENSA